MNLRVSGRHKAVRSNLDPKTPFVGPVLGPRTADEGESV